MRDRQLEKRGTILLILATLFWGLTFPIVKDSVAQFPVMLFCGLRFFVGSLLFFPILIVRKRFRRASVLHGLGIGIPVFLGYAFQTYGLRYTSATNSAFLTGLLVVFVPLLGALFLKQRLESRMIWALVISVVGLRFLAGPVSMEMNRGDLMTIICAFQFAIQILWISCLGSSHDAFLVTAMQLLSAGILSILVSVTFEGASMASLSAAPWGSILFCGIFASGLSFYLQVQCQKWVSASKAALIFITEPLWGALFSFLLDGDVLSVAGYFGAFLMMGGLLVAEYRRSPQSAG